MCKQPWMYGQVGDAQRVYDEMGQAQVAPDAATFHVLLTGLAAQSDWIGAHKLASTMPTHGVEIDRGVRTLLMRASTTLMHSYTVCVAGLY